MLEAVIDRSRGNAWIESIKVNAVSQEAHDGRIFWIKRRRVIARPILAIANIFFRLVGAPVRAIERTEAWQRWEIDSFERLHGDMYRCFSRDHHAIAVEQLSGMNLTSALDDGTLTEAMACAAGKELHRAHEIRSNFFDAGWSHGDPHLGNFVFDPVTSGARIIDFELRHVRACAEKMRHIDDVLVVLQDLLGRSAPDQWLSSARAFMAGYERSEIIAEAIERLTPPRGLASLWWSIRTSWLPRSEACTRIAELRDAIRVSSFRAEKPTAGATGNSLQPPIR